MRRALPTLALAIVLASPARAAAGEPLQPWAGKPLAPVPLTDREGAPVQLERYRGKVLVANLWATWCGPCQEEMPSLERLRIALAGKPVEVVAISVGDTPARIERFLAQLPLELPILLDRDRALLKAWQVRVMPTTYVFDATGRVRYRFVGARDWDDEVVLRTLDALLPR